MGFILKFQDCREFAKEVPCGSRKVMCLSSVHLNFFPTGVHGFGIF